MRHQFLFGGKPTPLLRVAFGIVAAAGLGYLIATLTSDYFTFTRSDWTTWVSIIVQVGVMLAAAAQAAAPVRFFWPGWIFAVAVIAPVPSGNLLTLAAWLTGGFGVLDTFIWMTLLGIVASVGTLLALYVWHATRAARRPSSPRSSPDPSAKASDQGRRLQPSTASAMA